MKKLLVTIMSVMLIFSISQAYVVTIHGPNCTFKMSSPSDSEIILSDLKNGIRWWKVTDNSNNIIGVINNEFMMPEDNVKVTPMYEGNQIVSIQTEGGDIKYNGNKVNTVETLDGGNYEFTIEADTGYKIKSLIIDGTSTTVSSSYTFTNVNENHTIKATFEKIIPILSNGWYGTPTVGETTIEKSSITSIALVDSYTPVGEVATSWNASSGQTDGILTAYLEDDGSENGTYKITIAGNGVGKISGGNLSSLFHSFNNVTEINGLGLLDTSKVTSTNAMFCGCNKLEGLDLSSFDTSKVTNMSQMFYGCRSLTKLDVSNFDTSKVTTMTHIFRECGSLTELDLSNFNTSKVIGMNYMFIGCSKLTKLDLSNFDTSNVTNMWGMFYGCGSLTELDVSNFDTSNVTNMSQMFGSCINLTELDLSNFNTSKVTNMLGMFEGDSKLTKLGLSSFDTSNVVDMSRVFSSCTGLTDLNISNFDTSKVTNMYSMFRNCSGLTSLDLGGFDTSQVKDMTFMFRECSRLTNLDVGSFDTSEVTSIADMFRGCSSLESIDVSSFDMSQVKDMGFMFAGCRNLTSLDVSKFSTSEATRMANMFNGCSRLTNLDLSNFDTSKVTDMTNMFNGCSNFQLITLGENFSFYGANKGVEGASVLSTLPGTTWYDEAGNSYTATEIAELSNPAGTYYTTNPVQ